MTQNSVTLAICGATGIFRMKYWYLALLLPLFAFAYTPEPTPSELLDTVSEQGYISSGQLELAEEYLDGSEMDKVFTLRTVRFADDPSLLVPFLYDESPRVRSGALSMLVKVDLVNYQLHRAVLVDDPEMVKTLETLDAVVERLNAP